MIGLLSLVFIVLPAKRGALVTLAVAYGITLVHYFASPGRIHKHRWRVAAAIVLSLSVLGVVVYKNRQHFETRITRKWEQWVYEREGFGAREVVWDVVHAHNADRSLWRTVLGSGFGSTTHILDNAMALRSHAHNDWLEVFTNMGAIGLGAFGLIHLAVLRQLVRARRTGFVLFPAFLCSYLCLLLPTFFSTTINATHILCHWMLIGHFVGLSERFAYVPSMARMSVSQTADRMASSRGRLRVTRPCPTTEF